MIMYDLKPGMLIKIAVIHGNGLWFFEHKKVKSLFVPNGSIMTFLNQYNNPVNGDLHNREFNFLFEGRKIIYDESGSVYSRHFSYNLIEVITDNVTI